MALQKQPVNINFAKGLDTKSDPFQLQPGNFLELENTIFTKAGLLQKRNGYGALTSLPDSSSTFLTTFNGNLTAIGTTLNAYSAGTDSWTSKGSLAPLSLEVLPLIRNNLNQTFADSAVSTNNLVCTVYAESDGSSTTYKYAVADVVTGQNVIAPTAIAGAGVTTYTPKVFLLGRYFVVVFNDVVAAVNRLKYRVINTATLAVGAATELSAAYSAASTGTFDGVVANNNLYLAWNSNTGGGAIRMTYIDSNLTQYISSNVATGYSATNISVTADETGSTPDIYVASFDSGTNVAKVVTVNQTLNSVHAATTVPMGADALKNITVVAQNGAATVIGELSKEYTYAAIKTNYVAYNTITRAGSLGTYTQIARSVGLASKAFLYESTPYFLAVYGGPQGQVDYQPTYFLLNLAGHVIAKLAYQEAGPYLITGLPSITLTGDTFYVPYLTKTLIQSVNKNTNVPAGSQTAGIYAQLGVNLVTMTFGTSSLAAAEIGKNLHLTGGFVSMYDGYLPVEHGFFLYPENIAATWSATGGSMVAKPDGATNTNAYYYQVTYEWNDNQGNIHRSAPSIPLAVTTTGALSTGSVVLNIPTLRLTYKTSNPIKIVIYRWSVAQQAYYQVTSITSPLMNSTTADSVTFTDTLADASILGNSLVYTTGGVLENIAATAANVFTLFQSRLFYVDAEDRNLIGFSKQVIESVPVEFSDLLSIYVAPTIGAQGDTGPIKALAALDDKLIIFKKNAIYYLNGTGPDNTGANSQFSEPSFITSTVGCDNPRSIVFMPNGLMFQSDKGIWLLDRGLSTTYIGAAVENYNDDAVQSAVNVPGTNQVRFTLDSGITLMYDYFYNQWGTFINVPAISSTLYEGLHTYINTRGETYQETPNLYLDGSNPVLIGFKTGWFNLAGLQGYQRAYFMYLLGVYKSPHRLQIQIGYDYKEGATQTSYIQPDNYSLDYGDDTLWGGSSAWGGNSQIEQWRVFFNQQKCESFQIKLKEIYDPTVGAPAGAGLTLSGITLIVGAKKGYTTLKQSRSTG
jgi:hypothetical protein